DLLALHLARVTRHETGAAQRLAQRLVVFHQSARDAMADRTGLPGRAAASHRRVHVELALELARDERLAHDHARRLAAEEHVEGRAVHGDLAAAGTQEHARGGSLPPAGAVVTFGCHGSYSSKGIGCCAWCGCSDPRTTFSFRSICRPSALRGSMPFTASSRACSGARASSFSSGSDFMCPMYPVWWW